MEIVGEAVKIMPKEDNRRFPNKKYSIIYADPPWKYQSTSSPNQINKYSSTKAKSYYETMSIDDICKIPVDDIADENCCLFLWVTFPLINDCLKVFKSWGFVFKTLGFSWLKINKKDKKPYFGIGYYTKSNVEVCLLGIKGKMKPISNYVSSVIISPIEGHSKKPDIVRDRIVELFGDLPRIELFARQRYDGWDAWGNEVDKFTQHSLRMGDVHG